jgi:hypothetical protein
MSTATARREIRHRVREGARVEGLSILSHPQSTRARPPVLEVPDGQPCNRAGGRESEGVREVLDEVIFQREKDQSAPSTFASRQASRRRGPRQAAR